MDSPVTLAFTFAADLAKQLMTLSTGVMALSITFTKDLVERSPPSALRWLRVSWALYLASLLFGVWTLMALTGSLAPIQTEQNEIPDTIGSNVRIPAALQISAFLAATVCVVLFGWRALIKGDGRQSQGNDLKPFNKPAVQHCAAADEAQLNSSQTSNHIPPVTPATAQGGDAVSRS